MIIYYDNNYPIITLEINSFLELDYITFKKNFEYILDLSLKDEIYINLNIDIFNITDYSLIYIGYLINYLTNISISKLKYINKVDILIDNNNNKIFTIIIEYINNLKSPIKIYIKKLLEKKKWK